jgi:hypothetical protein
MQLERSMLHRANPWAVLRLGNHLGVAIPWVWREYVIRVVRAANG